MRCPGCRRECRASDRFCEECGARLVRVCAACGTETGPEARFCPSCGTRLREGETAAVPHAEEAQRRHLTVMFCDVVGSTGLSERLDPEELRALLAETHRVCAEVIGRFDGHVAQYLGDGTLVYFGYPSAHEDDAARAVRAGLGILEGLEDRRRRGAHDVHVRIGIHTGEVVVGGIGGGGRVEQLALGETPNVAARLQGLAAPDELLISRSTHRLLAETFECRALGPRVLKGLSAPIEVLRVVHEREEGDAPAPAAGGEGVLLGRDEEIALLRRHWDSARDGRGQVVVISGEPGIGKSRLLGAFRRELSREGHPTIQFRCSGIHRTTPFFAVIEHLRRLLGFSRSDPPEEKVARLEAVIGATRLGAAEAVPLLAGLLSLSPAGRFAELDWTPERRKEKTREVLVRWLLEETERRPTLVVWEDLQWADASTLELLGLLVAQAPAGRMLALLTHRPDFVLPPSARSHAAQITLGRLDRRQIEEMTERIAGGRRLPAEVLRQIVVRTDGVPLFVEELTKMILESGWLSEAEDRWELRGPLPPLAIPVTLRDSLAARLDRLAPVREVAQVAATIGREFSWELIAAVAPHDPQTLRHGLAQLVEAELLFQKGLGDEARYVFKHALIHEAAYDSLLRSRRQQFHLRIAQAYQERFPEVAAERPELLGHHFGEAGLAPEAIAAWKRAAERAIDRSANAEAIEHLRRGLTLLDAEPPSAARDHEELDLRVLLGPAVMATHGYAAADVEAVYARARELCRGAGDTARLLPALHGLSTFHLVRGDFETARSLGEELLARAASAGDVPFRLEAHHVLGTTLFHLGDLAASLRHLEECVSLYDPERDGRLALRHGHDPAVASLCTMTRILWFLGRPDRALERSRAAMALAERVRHPFSRAFAFVFAAIVCQLRREREAADTHARAAVAISEEHGFAPTLAMGTVLSGWARLRAEDPQPGLSEMRRGVEAWHASGAELLRPHLLALLASAYGEIGRPEEGLAVLAEASAAAHLGGRRFYEPEIHRLEGELRLAARPDEQEAAEAAMAAALDTARRQGGLSWELRAATSLARVWGRSGRVREAVALLDEVCARFTEGLDTADFRDAAALRRRLAPAREVPAAP